MTKKPQLAAVSNVGVTHLEPPPQLGETGRALWGKVMAEYVIDDCAGLELLAQCCRAADRAAALQSCIDRDGETILTESGVVKAHPALRDELACRNFVVQVLGKLGLGLEPVRSAGRQPGVPLTGWR